MDSIEAIENIVTHGKNNMSAFSEKLSQLEIEKISAYVLEKAATGWH
jgi:cytochrome c6